MALTIKQIKPQLFRDQVVLQTRVRTPTKVAGATIVWNDTAEVWAKVTPLSARQLFFADQLQHRITHKFLLRFREDISVTIDKRFTWQERIFQIQGVIDVEERRCFLEVSCFEGEET